MIDNDNCIVKDIVTLCVIVMELQPIYMIYSYTDNDGVLFTGASRVAGGLACRRRSAGAKPKVN